ncbi:hypothetical protein E2C01_022147 [Portunus trituberculatus]|uniref:Uncharacterized protein n=1 Tax=Portunus trituberculatus TaxID=210409 RepID=A0A5B7E4L3_PORTR|nr:hypothetical protein [Portunus trituberculatus]
MLHAGLFQTAETKWSVISFVPCSTPQPAAGRESLFKHDLGRDSSTRRPRRLTLTAGTSALVTRRTWRHLGCLAVHSVDLIPWSATRCPHQYHPRDRLPVEAKKAARILQAAHAVQPLPCRITRLASDMNSVCKSNTICQDVITIATVTSPSLNPSPGRLGNSRGEQLTTDSPFPPTLRPPLVPRGVKCTSDADSSCLTGWGTFVAPAGRAPLIGKSRNARCGNVRAMPPALSLLPPPSVRWATPRCWVASLVGAASQVESRGVQKEPWAQTLLAAGVVVVGDQTEPRGEWVPLEIAW